MKIAIISDIHSNIDALESVLDDINERQVDQIVCTGDLVGYLAYPNEVVACIQSNNIKCIKGNHDLKVLEYKMPDISNKTQEELQASASIIFTSQTINEKNLSYLRSLPEKLIIEHEGLKVLFVHGSPRKINEYMYEDDDHLKEIAEALDEDILVFGHTHIPYHKVIENKHFINPGSVGKPKHGNSKSAYMILNIEPMNISSQMIQVSYDLSNICDTIENEALISNQLIDQLKNGY